MPSALNSIPKWERPQKTKYELDWADLSIIDLSEFDQPGGKQKLADQLKNAVCLFLISENRDFTHSPGTAGPQRWLFQRHWHRVHG